MPLITIGMPVYNEERFLPASLDSLLAQECRDFELVISDNASTDGTREICQRYASRDSRIRYLRSERNHGATENFNRPLKHASGKYFMWAAGHDLWDRRFLTECSAVMERDSLVALCYPRTRWVGPDGETLREVSDGLGTEGLGTAARFNTVMWRAVKCTAVYGLIRLSVLRKAKLRKSFGADLVLLTEMSCYGTFVELPMALFHRRMNRPPEEPEDQVSRMYEMLTARPRNRRRDLPYCEMIASHFQMVTRAQVAASTKAVMLASSALCLPVRYHRRVISELLAVASSPFSVMAGHA